MEQQQMFGKIMAILEKDKDSNNEDETPHLNSESFGGRIPLNFS